MYSLTPRKRMHNVGREGRTEDLGVAVLDHLAVELERAERRVDEMLDARLLDLVDRVPRLLALALRALLGVVALRVALVPLPPWCQSSPCPLR